jgi:hypothetical protein
LLKQGLKALGQSILIITGVGYGVVKALDALDGLQQEPPAPPMPIAEPEVTLKRLDGMEERLIRMEKSLEVLALPLRRPVEDHVTRTELNAAIRKLSVTVESDIERRFEVQDRSVQSLRTMIVRTDELLEQVLESIESTSIPA